MSSKDWKSIILIFLVALAVFLQISSALECDDTRCKTGDCDKDGQCICQLPAYTTILDGNRPFLGGEFCDEEQVMCDGTNSFWCENGGTCDEIIQGENYTCKCQPGYIGKHCEHSGSPCGNIFCFHQAECIKEDSICDCPPDWKGSDDCALSTKVGSCSDCTPPSLKWIVVIVSLVVRYNSKEGASNSDQTLERARPSFTWLPLPESPTNMYS
eukprot:Gb_11515 [translate_table: standard]